MTSSKIDNAVYRESSKIGEAGSKQTFYHSVSEVLQVLLFYWEAMVMNTILTMDKLAKNSALVSEVAETAEAQFATGIHPPDPELYSMDPAERLEFSRYPNVGVTRFDTRDDRTLKSVMFDHEDPVERERAAWEYGDRHKAEAVKPIIDFATKESARAGRWGALWLLQKIAGNRAADALALFLRDEDVEIRDWTHLLTREITGYEVSGRPNRPIAYDPSNPFDQTLPLVIAGYARAMVPGMGWVQAVLSPQWFESIQGRVMACTRHDTFSSDLVIEKRIKSYNPDGSSHYEIYKFKGFTFDLSDCVHRHSYESHSTHTFYPSGKIKDVSITPLDDVGVVLARDASTIVLSGTPFESIHEINSSNLENGRLDTKPNSRYVASVRGRFKGPAYINIPRLLESNMKIGPGEVQLCALHHPIAGPLANVALFGTFRGKLSDLNDDGYLDVNTEQCHATVDGHLDFNLEGTPNPDPFDPFQKV